jgi:SagB-type dehydrogenase family enzyme
VTGRRRALERVGIVEAEEIVIAYHERTKHHVHRFAASSGNLDWATQPDPFRRYTGAPLVRFPRSGGSFASVPYGRLFARGDALGDADGAIAPGPLSLESVSLFFRHALSLTAWKEYRGVSWALRANPSSGNLHPTEGYAILPPVSGICAGPAVHHYTALDHGLERRADLDPLVWREWAESTGTAELGDSFLFGLTSVHWREAWKYGERAYRYCQHDVGHALAAARIAAAALGWRLVVLTGVADSAIARLLGTDREADYAEAEREHPDLLAWVTPSALGRDEARSDHADRPGLLDRLGATARHWQGTANVLSPTHAADWPVIEEVARAAWRGDASPIIEAPPRPSSRIDPGDIAPYPDSATTARVILGRRSAVRMDGKTAIAGPVFYRMLARLLPDAGVPWDAIPWTPRIHSGFFVHRVEGLVPGVYMLIRDPGRLDALRGAMRTDFIWERPASCPAGIDLYLLHEADCRESAATLSCGQEIASDGAFSVAMIADYASSLAKHGAPFYRNLFWEAGMVGQMLYLEAEAAGVRGTGIGCYFDDPVHSLFGIRSREWQSLYHFTVGGPVEDTRLTTREGYDE